MLVVEGVQVGGQELARHRVAGTDGQRAQQQLLGLGQLVLAGGQQAQGVADVLIEHLPLPRQGHAPGRPGKQPGLQGRFQLLDGLAHRRLGDVQIFRRRRNISRLRYLFKDTVQLQLHCHICSSIIKDSCYP